MLPDEELIEGCKKKQNYAQMLLYKKYAPSMKAVCLMYVKDPDTVKDVIQDSFIKIFEHLPSYRSEGPLGAWIRKIVVNTSLKYIKKSNKEGKLLVKEYSEQIDVIDETEEEDLDDSIKNLSSEEIYQAISSLPEKFRLIFSLFHLENYSHKEIAEKLAINEGFSRVLLNRSKIMLRKALFVRPKQMQE